MKNKDLTLLGVIGLIILSIFIIESFKNVVSPEIEIPKYSLELLNKTPTLLAPNFRGIVNYINSDSNLTIDSLKGKIVLVDFWTYTCINCIRTLPHLNSWHEKYSKQGLVIVGIHTPEFEFEKDYDNVLKAVKDFEIKYPILLDNDYITWRSYNNHWWPHKYLIDSEGYIRYHHIGEGAYDETEKAIQELLNEIGVNRQNFTTLPDKTPNRIQTPELYAGYGFNLPKGQNLGNIGGLRNGTVFNYSHLGTLFNDIIYLNGGFESGFDYLRTINDESSNIKLRFNSNKVNIVSNYLNKTIKVEVLVDGNSLTEDNKGKDIFIEKGRSYFLVDFGKLYEIFNSKHGTYDLELKIDSKNFSFYAFTFG